MLYWLWGNVLCAGSLSFSAICSQARPAVLVAVIWVIMSGFGANLVLTQFIEQGPSVAATILQIIPSMGLFRGVHFVHTYVYAYIDIASCIHYMYLYIHMMCILLYVTVCKCIYENVCT